MMTVTNDDNMKKYRGLNKFAHYEKDGKELTFSITSDGRVMITGLRPAPLILTASQLFLLLGASEALLSFASVHAGELEMLESWNAVSKELR